jgi:hypothetical protein
MNKFGTKKDPRGEYLSRWAFACGLSVMFCGFCCFLQIRKKITVAKRQISERLATFFAAAALRIL